MYCFWCNWASKPAAPYEGAHATWCPNAQQSDLEKRVVEYLADFPHRDEKMEQYGVCRKWLKDVLEKEAKINATSR